MSAVLEKLAKEIEPAESVDADPRIRRMTRTEYHRAAESGVFKPDERLELIKGEVYEKVSPQGRPHALAILKASGVIQQAFSTGFHIQAQLPLQLGEDSEPEPDLTVLPGHEDDYPDHPDVGVAALILEVSDSTINFDRGKKASLYAEAGVQEYWIVNIRKRKLEVYRQPESIPEDPYVFGYRSRIAYDEEETISPLGAPRASIRVGDLLPKQKIEDSNA